MLKQATLFDSNGATSSEASGGGNTHCSLQAGQRIDQSGPAVVPVSRSLRQESKKAKKTKDTSGLKCSGSFESAALTQLLVNKCRQRLDTVGSMEYSQTWKQNVTPAGRLYWEHTASARRTSAKDCTGWPTPQYHDHKNLTSMSHQHQSLVKTSQMAGCPSSFPASATKTETVPTVESTTPNADVLDRHKTDTSMRNEMESCSLAGWVSPTAQDSVRGSLPPRPQDTGIPLSQMVSYCGWTSPSSPDWKDTPGMATEAMNPDGSLRRRVDQLPRQAQLTSGQTSESPPAQTAKRGVLDAAFSRWLMGFPETWDEASPNWGSWQEVQEAIASGGSRATEMP